MMIMMMFICHVMPPDCILHRKVNLFFIKSPTLCVRPGELFSRAQLNRINQIFVEIRARLRLCCLPSEFDTRTVIELWLNNEVYKVHYLSVWAELTIYVLQKIDVNLSMWSEISFRIYLSFGGLRISGISFNLPSIYASRQLSQQCSFLINKLCFLAVLHHRFFPTGLKARRKSQLLGKIYDIFKY